MTLALPLYVCASITGDALRKATHTEIGYGCLVLFLSGPITIAHQAYGYYMGVTEAVGVSDGTKASLNETPVLSIAPKK